MQYQPGVHLIATLHSDDTTPLLTYTAFKQLLDAFVADYSLQQLGAVYHDFEPGGFTAVLCLSESHVSIHTWPEFGKINLDIYLSNYQRVNDDTVLSMFDRLVVYFRASVVQKLMIYR